MRSPRFVLAACTHAEAPPAVVETDAREAPLILISIDGFRPDYLDRGLTPTMSALAAEGVRGSMRPSFPSLTFPNHITLVTGRRPDRHGIVNNRMEDPEIPGVTFALHDRAVLADARWWSESVPLWVSAEEQGVATATMFWPGSETPIRGRQPQQWQVFDQSRTNIDRVDTLLSFFDANPPPRFLTLYFDSVDTAGHFYGPESQQVNDAVLGADFAIARLMAGLEARGVDANIVIVSDHGMAPVGQNQVVDLDALVTAEDARVVMGGAVAGINPAAGREAAVEGALIVARDHMQCWRKAELPARFHFGVHRRIPAIICLAETGWLINSLQLPQYRTPSRGAHGYDPEDPTMAAVFIAHGPAFRSGVTLPAIDNVDVYPVLVQLIEVSPEANDGEAAALEPALAR